MGGADAVARLRCSRLEQKGKQRLGGKDVGFDCVTLEAPPDKLKIVQTLYHAQADKVVPYVFTQAIAGAEGWTKADTEAAAPAPADVLATLKEQRHYARVEKLLDLRSDPAFTVKLLPSGKVDGKPVDRLEVAHADMPTYVLAFARDTGLLAKISCRLREANGPRMVDQEVFYRDWRKVGGLL